MTENKKQKAVFLDRDGTLIEEVNFLSRLEDLRLFPFSGEAVKLLNEHNFLVILVTNQSGVARGFFDEETLHELHAELKMQLSKLNARFDAVYFCPHHAVDKCDCRKPKTGMIGQANRDFLIDLENSWMIGDKAIDVETGFNANLKTALVLTGYGQIDVKKLKKKPDIVAKNLLQAIKKITSKF